MADTKKEKADLNSLQKKLNSKKSVPANLFALFYRVLVIIAITAVFTPMTYTLTSGFLEISSLICSFLIFIFLMLGYMLQSVYSAVTRNKRSREIDYGYESNETLFHIGYAILPLIISLVIAYLTKVGVDKLSLYFYETGKISKYDPYSLYPFLFAILIFVFMAAGIILWFYPTDRIVSIKMFFFGTAFIMIWFMTFLYGNSSIVTPASISLTVYFICALLLMNQTYIIKIFRGSVVSVITPPARFYNMLLVFAMVVMIILLLGFMFLILSGFAILFKMLGFILIYSVLRGNDSQSDMEYYDSEEAAVDFSGAVFGREGGNFSYFIFSAFIAVIVIILIVTIFGRTNFFKNLFLKLQKFLQDILDFFSNSAYFWGHSDYSNTFVSYRDEEIKLQNAKIREYNPNEASFKTYKDFQAKLSKCNTTNEKLTCAYLTLIYLYRKMNISIKTSDTPREIKEKVSKSVDNKTEINDMTQAIELIKYAEVEPDKYSAEKTLDSVCAIIKRYLY